MGKGDNRRPTQIDDARFSERWCVALGRHKLVGQAIGEPWCINCGKSESQLAQPQSPQLDVAPDGEVQHG